MKDILMRILAKRGIKAVDELSKDEQQTFKEWQGTLSKEELNLEDVKNFCQQQISIIEGKWSDYNLEESKKTHLLPYYSVYRTLLKTIDSPKVAREALEKNLIQLLEN